MGLTTAATTLAMGLLVLTGCAAEADPGASTAGASATAPEPPPGRSTGAAAAPAVLRFESETIDGSSFDGRSLAGKPTVFWFWAPWCPTCRAQAPGVSRIAEEYGGRVNVVGVGGLSDAGDIRDFATQVDGPLHLVDEDGALWRHFGVTAQSTYLVLDADGAIVADGYLDDHVLAAQVDELAG
ncbi:MAG: redoxin family protein [Actinomycetes bacterium]